MELETRVYQKSQKFNVVKLLKQSLKDIKSSFFLARQLAVRDITSQYRQSYFGMLWIIILPLITAFVWVFLNSTGTVKLSDTGIPYPVFAFSGTLIWSIINDSVNSPIKSTNSARGIMSKINFPKEALILSGIYKLLFNSSIKIVLLVTFIFVYGIGFNWSMLLFPFAVLAVVLVGTTLGLFLTPIGLLYSDISKMITLGFQFLMYITPVVYAIPKEGIMKTVMELNPFTTLILTSRDFVVGTTPEYLNYFIIVTVVCIPLFFIALLLYRVAIPVIIERLSA
jgi:lipopolysaccharide transport system permease protein